MNLLLPPSAVISLESRILLYKEAYLVDKHIFLGVIPVKT